MPALRLRKPALRLRKPAVGMAGRLIGSAAIAAGIAAYGATTAAWRHSAPASRPADPLALEHSAQVALTGQSNATLAVVSGAATVTVTAAPMPGSLIRAWTPDNSGVRPQLVSAAGRIQLFLADTGQHGPSAVSIELSNAVAWQFQFGGGTGQTVLNLANAKISGVDITAGSSLIQLTLPRPAGTVPITLSSGAGQVDLAVPGGVATQLRLDGGASTATIGGRAHVGLAKGTVLSSPGWARAVSRYYVDATGGIGNISVTG